MPPTLTSLRRPRFAFIDAGRTFAMLLMVQAHVCDNLLLQAAKSTVFFQTYWHLRGITAPLFFMLSGLAVVVASDPHWNDYSQFHPKLYARLRRIAVLMIIGYLFHVPRWISLLKYTPEQWAYLLRFGVLQCIAVSLFIIHLLIFILPNKKAFGWISLAIALIAIGLAPAINTSTTSLPLFFSQAIRVSSSSPFPSLFPLFPYMAHVFLGAALGRLYLDWRPLQNSPTRLAYLVGSIAISCLLLGTLIKHPSNVPASANTVLLCTRIGGAWLFFSILSFLVAKASSPVWLKSISSNALSVYVLHLLVIYGVPGIRGLRSRIGPNLTLAETFIMGPVVLITCAMIMALWDYVWRWARTAFRNDKGSLVPSPPAT